MQDRKAGALRLKIWLPRTWNEETCAGLCTTSGTHSSVRRYNTRRRSNVFQTHNDFTYHAYNPVHPLHFVSGHVQGY